MKIKIRSYEDLLKNCDGVSDSELLFNKTSFFVIPKCSNIFSKVFTVKNVIKDMVGEAYTVEEIPHFVVSERWVEEHII